MLELIRATEKDAPALTALSKLSFDDDTVRFMDGKAPGPPGYDSLATTEHMIANYETYRVLADGQLIGAAVMYAEDGKWMVGRIFLSPHVQGKGFGRELMQLLEEQYRSKGTLYLDTPKANERTNLFYTNCGYTVYQTDSYLNCYHKKL